MHPQTWIETNLSVEGREMNDGYGKLELCFKPIHARQLTKRGIIRIQKLSNESIHHFPLGQISK